MGRARTFTTLLGGLVVALGGTAVAAPAPVGAGGQPSWPQTFVGSTRTSLQPDETRLSTTTVGRLKPVRSYPLGAGASLSQLVVGHVLYAHTSSRVGAFDADGVHGCSGTPVTCTPMWTAPAANFYGMTVGGGLVFVTHSNGVIAYDAANGNQVWATSTAFATGPGFRPGPGSPLLVGGLLYVPGAGQGKPPAEGGAYVAAFDADGSSGCAGSPSICTPLWTTTGQPSPSTGNIGAPSVVGGRLYVANGALVAFDARGRGCDGTPLVCQPLWTGTLTASAVRAGAPAISGGRAFVTTSDARVAAFDATGAEGCTTTAGSTTCFPLWTGALSGTTLANAAVGNGLVYAMTSGGVLAAYEAAGSRGCRGPVDRRTCTPVWRTAAGPTGYSTHSTPALAGGVVVVSSTDGGTYAYDATGERTCSHVGLPRICSPLWRIVTGWIGGDPAIVVGGIVYAYQYGNSTLYAYGLAPAPPTAPAATAGAVGTLRVRSTLGDGNGSPITSQAATCVSSTGGVTGRATHKGATAAPIVVTGLTHGATYACTVTESNAAGRSRPSPPTADVLIP